MTDTSGGDDTKIIFKDSVTGQIVTQEYAERHPKRTYALEVPEDATASELLDIADGEPVEDVTVFPVGDDTDEHDTLGEP